MDLQEYEIVKSIDREVLDRLGGEATSTHDISHVRRVCAMASRIRRKEGGSQIVVSLAALLHDIADWKFHHGDEEIGPNTARIIMSRHGVDKAIADYVCEIISTLSFRGSGVLTPMRTLEGKIVQDADRIDAMGPVGIARHFAWCGHAGIPLHDPLVKPRTRVTAEEYKKGIETGVNHFFEKLLLLYDLLNTETARTIALPLHEHMKAYIELFAKQWDCKS